MRVRINGQEAVIPTSLSEITLGQRIDFHEQHGSELNEMATSIIEMEDGYEKDLEKTEFQIEKMFRTFAFFAGTTVEALKESQFIDDIARIYHSSLAILFDDEQNIELQQEYIWKGETWELHPPKLAHGSKMKVGEFIDAKQMIKNMIDVGKGKWEYMLPLCAIYLRKKGEPYQKEFIFDGSDRMELMRELPLDIALAVGFFLSASTNFSISILESSNPPGSKAQVSIPKNTMTAGVGSTSSKRSQRPRYTTSRARA